MRKRIEAAIIRTSVGPVAEEPSRKCSNEGKVTVAPSVPNADALRQQMKELALQRRLEEERRLEEQEERQRAERIQTEAKQEGTEYQEDQEEHVEETDEETTEPFLCPKFKPTFISTVDDDDSGAAEAEAAQQERRREAHRLLADFIRRGGKADPGLEDRFQGGEYDPRSVDDTDGLVGEGEEERLEWQLRELSRLKRDREERERWERDQLEMERIRNLTEEEKRKIDSEKQAEWESQPSSQYRFMQKYYHRGAFFTDTATSDPLFQRDYGQATGGDRANVEMLPEVLQVRDFGKKGRSKWKHLTAEDTTGFEYGWGQRSNQLNYRNIPSMAGMRSTTATTNRKRPRADEKTAD